MNTLDVVSWIKSMAENPPKYKFDGTTVTFKAKGYYGAIGIATTAIGLGCAFIPDPAAIFLSLLFGVLGILCMLYGYVMGLSLDPNKIVYRGPFRSRREILWRDVRCVSVVSTTGDLMVSSRTSRIRIFAYLNGFNDIKTLVCNRFPSASEQIIQADASDEFEKVSGRVEYGIKKNYLFVPILFMALGLLFFTADMLESDRNWVNISLSVAMLFVAVLFLLYILLARIIISEEKLIYHTLFGREKAIRWEDIQNVTVIKGLNEVTTIADAYTRIKIGSDFKGYMTIKSLILNRIPKTATVIGKSL